MSAAAIAGRYARAVLEIAKERDQVKALCKELRTYADCYEQSAELRAIEMAPELSDERRKQIIDEIGERLGVSETVKSTVSLLAARNRLAILPDLAEQLAELADEHLGVVRASVRAARRLPDSYLRRLEAKIADATGKRVLLDFTEDPSLIAGVVTKVGDRVVDGSIRGKLDRLAASLHQS